MERGYLHHHGQTDDSSTAGNGYDCSNTNNNRAGTNTNPGSNTTSTSTGNPRLDLRRNRYWRYPGYRGDCPDSQDQASGVTQLSG